MLTPSEFGALPRIDLTREAVMWAIKNERITPAPIPILAPSGAVRRWEIDPKAKLAKPRKPGPKGPRNPHKPGSKGEG